MAQSNKEPEKRASTPGKTAAQEMWAAAVQEKMSGIDTGLYSAVLTPTKPKPSQPTNRRDDSYLYGVLAAMSAGHCKLKDVYTTPTTESWERKIVAGFETPSKRYVLVPIELPALGSTIPDDWFLELKARIVMECSE